MTLSSTPTSSLANQYVHWLISPKARIYLHCSFIAFLFFAAYFRDVSYTPMAAFGLKATVVACILAVFYGNVYWLVPRYLFRGRFLVFALFAAVFTTVIYHTVVYTMIWLEPYHTSFSTSTRNREMSVPFFIFMMMVLISASASVRLFQQWIWDNKMILELQESKAIAELEQLKNQINPHFLLNMLNNANVLTRRDPDKASLVLLGLSDLLRYQLYDSVREKVLLTADIHFLEDLLHLEKIRRDDFEYIISKEGVINGIEVSPLLFVTFVENALKHGNDTDRHAYTNIFFKIENGVLHFKCVNSKPAVKTVESRGGLGLVNVRRRLNLLYPSRHTLTIEDNPGTYSVILTLNL